MNIKRANNTVSRDLKEIVAEIKERIDIVELIGGLVPIKKHGKDYWAVCPFHADSDPSLSVVPAKRIFYCFGCRATGDVVGFWMRFHKVDFIAAVRALAARAGISMAGGYHGMNKKQYPTVRRSEEWTPEEYESPTGIWQEKAGRFIAWAFEQLFDDKAAQDFLASRGIRTESVVAYGLGYCKSRKGGDLYRSREAWGLPVIDDKKVLWLPKGWTIPYLDKDGRVLKIRIRRSDLSFRPEMRYYFVPGSSSCTTILNPDAKAHVVVESDLDAVLIEQEAGDLVGAVPMGSVATRPDSYAVDILKQSCHVLVALDFDKAGAMAWPWWQKHVKDCVRWPVPEGKDPGEAWQKGVDIRQWIMAGLPEGLRRMSS